MWTAIRDNAASWAGRARPDAASPAMTPFWKAGEAVRDWHPVCTCGAKIDLSAPVSSFAHATADCPRRLPDQRPARLS